MHTNELSLLRRICDANPRLSVHDLTPEERGMLSTLRRDGLITQNLDGFLLPRDTAFPALKEAEQRLSLDEALRAQEESFRQQLLQVQQQATESLMRMRQEFADYAAKQQDAQALHEKLQKKNRRKDVRNSRIGFAINILFTFLTVILDAYIDFDKSILKWLFDLFHG